MMEARRRRRAKYVSECTCTMQTWRLMYPARVFEGRTAVTGVMANNLNTYLSFELSCTAASVSTIRHGPAFSRVAILTGKLLVLGPLRRRVGR